MHNGAHSFAMSGAMSRLATLLSFPPRLWEGCLDSLLFSLRCGLLDACPQDCTGGASLATLDPRVPYRTGFAEEVGDSMGDSVGDSVGDA